MTDDWKPISEAQLWDEINAAHDRMPPPQRRLWDAIKVPPVKWQQHPWGDQGNGFWVVAVLGNRVVWFNDIEDGFNTSRFEAWGQIPDNEYWCNQDELEWPIQYLLNELEGNQASVPRFGPPQPLA